MSTERERVNNEINHPEIRLILEDGSQHGLVSSEEALRMAKAAGLDLVEISPTAKPPVARILDYSKFRYERAKREREARRRQRVNQVELKELKFRPKIDEHDYGVKLRHARRFLGEGNKVKLVVRYRGREIVFQSHGIELLERIVKELEDIAIVEKRPEMLGRQQIMIIAPRLGA